VIFADTSYWIALIDGRDKWHSSISEVLTNDKHFTQEGFAVLLVD
jgi:predicted nucleic acid-binding protein